MRFIVALLMLLVQVQASAKVIDTVGAIYPIAEDDALEEIGESAKKVDWGKVFDKKVWEKRIKEFRPKDSATLPRAEKDRTRLIDMTYTLEFDIPDEKGNIIYPRGYAFNPLEYITAAIPTLVVIDAGSKEQLDWYKGSPYSGQADTMLLITGGSWYELTRELKHPVFYLTAEIKERLKLEAAPSVVSQKGRFMEVREYEIGKKGK